MDMEKLRAAARMILEAIGEDPERDGLKNTPDRVARMYAEVFRGLHEDPAGIFSAVFEEPYDEIVIVRDIPFHSMCEHHLLPFSGVAHTAYLPKDRIVGISKLARAVEHFARRPQVQERLTNQVADLVEEALKPRGVAVVIEGTHSCMTLRGIQKPGSSVVTSTVRGLMRDQLKTRNEVMQLIYNHRL